MSDSGFQASGRLISGFGDDPPLRWAAADLCGPLREACRLLDLSPVAAGALGRCLTAAVLLHRMAVKTPSRLVVSISGDGPLARVMAEVDRAGDVRGTVSAPHVEVPLGDPAELGVSRAMGNGLLQVWREGKRSSYQSQVELFGGQIGDALTRYLEQSEQTRSAVLLGVLAESSGIRAAGGVMVEALPGGSEDALRALERRLIDFESVSRTLADEGLNGLLARLLDGVGHRAAEDRSLRYRCRCSDGSIRQYLQRLGQSERNALRTESGELVAECVFCGTSYRFDDEPVSRRTDAH